MGLPTLVYILSLKLHGPLGHEAFLIPTGFVKGKVGGRAGWTEGGEVGRGISLGDLLINDGDLISCQ